jgi:hypothetical protein
MEGIEWEGKTEGEREFPVTQVVSGNGKMFKTGMDSIRPHSVKNTESCHFYAEADGAMWGHLRQGRCVS